MAFLFASPAAPSSMVRTNAFNSVPTNILNSQYTMLTPPQPRLTPTNHRPLARDNTALNLNLGIELSKTKPALDQRDSQQPKTANYGSSIAPYSPQIMNNPSTPPANFQLSRPLSGNERFYYDSAEHRNGWGTSAMCLRIKADAPDIPDIKRALTCLQQRHIALRSHIEPGNTPWRSPQWIADDAPAALPYALEITEKSDAWKDTLNSLITTKVDPSKDALIRFALLYNPAEKTCDILLGFHHALMDGMSAWHLMQTFTQLCWNKNHQSCPPCAPPAGQENSFFDRSEKELHASNNNMQSALGKVVSSTFAHGLKNRFVKRNPEFTHLPETDTETNPDRPLESIKYARKILPPHVSEKFVEQCRAQDTNLTGAITAIALKLSKHLFQSKCFGYTPMQYVVPISLRKQIPKWPIEDLGVCITTSNHITILPPDPDDSLWEQAKNCKKHLHEAITSGTPAATFQLLEQLEAPLSPEPIVFSHMPKNYILINNLGKLTPPSTDENISYEALSWATNQGDESALAQFYIASVGDKLSLTIQSNQLTQNQVDQLAEKMEEQIHRLIIDPNA